MDLTLRTRTGAELGADPAYSSPDAQALAHLLAWQQENGITFEHPDEPVEPYGHRTEEIRGEPW